ncbi:MAG: hypothetical protein MJZ95_04175 [Paludibacteraceae bacterium]|nr:hypothetical protein [Paludibacteraceae bacterium]
MINRILVILFLSFVAMNAMFGQSRKQKEAEEIRQKAIMAYQAYRFREAREMLEEYLASDYRDMAKDAETVNMLNRAEKAANMLDRVESVTITDSTVVDKERLLNAYTFGEELGQLVQTGKGMMYVSGRGDRSVYSENGDIWCSWNGVRKYKIAEGVNTGADEDYPFLMADGVTLYYASNGDESIGGYDIFMSRYNNEVENFMMPVQIGMPFNSTANDYMMVIDELNGNGWFATDRGQTEGKVIVYQFAYNEECKQIDNVCDSIRREYAQLKRYARKEGKRERKILKETETDGEGICFRVNDTIEYNNVRQFRDAEALRLYEQTAADEMEVMIKEIELEGLRREYRTSYDKTDIEILTSEILKLEDEVLIIKDSIRENYNKIRIIENKFYVK